MFQGPGMIVFRRFNVAGGMVMVSAAITVSVSASTAYCIDHADGINLFPWADTHNLVPHADGLNVTPHSDGGCHH